MSDVPNVMRVNKIHSKYKVPNLERALEIIELLKDHPGGRPYQQRDYTLAHAPSPVRHPHTPYHTS